MTKAQEMREITKQAQEIRTQKRIAKHEKYANKIINRRVKFTAECGHSSTIKTLSNRYSKTLVIEALIDKGFAVEEVGKTKGGKYKIKIKW